MRMSTNEDIGIPISASHGGLASKRVTALNDRRMGGASRSGTSQTGRSLRQTRNASMVCHVNGAIQNGLERLTRLQEKYGLPIICEPKLGINKSPAGIQYFRESSIESWKNIGICIDIGDFLMAIGDNILDYLEKWSDFIKVVHLHNVEFNKDHKYWWIPVHPSHETDGIHYRLEEIIRFLARSHSKTFIFEHTPHGEPSPEFVQQGYAWVKRLVDV